MGDAARSPGSPRRVEAARGADAAIVFANNAQGEGMDRTSLALPGDQDELIAAVAAANPRTIVVLNTGGPGAHAVAAATSRPCSRPGTPASGSARRSPTCSSATPIRAAACR